MLPHALTAALAVVVTLGIQWLWLRPPATAPAPAATAAPATPAPPPPVTPPVATPAASPPDGSVVRLEVLDLQAQDRQLWSALYLLRAASQIDDAVAALQRNDLIEADRTLLTAYRSLDRAYVYSAEREKGPIDNFRLQLSQIRDDLHLRPERLDRRLRQLRQLMLSLVDEGG
ncbi:MAG: hypothetical protein N2378_01465 [Chloroflexaceae bacterium]|nr:hypothetical protein [Chloroflexaceae bacterium]